MSTARPELDIPEESTETDKEKSRVERVIEKVVTGLGDGVGALADKGILFVVFAVIWVAFGGALIWSQGSLDAAWQWVRDLPWLVQGLVWLLFLPVKVGLWIWETSWSLVWRLALIVSLAGWTLLVFPRPWSRAGSRRIVSGVSPGREQRFALGSEGGWTTSDNPHQEHPGQGLSRIVGTGLRQRRRIDQGSGS